MTWRWTGWVVLAGLVVCGCQSTRRPALPMTGDPLVDGKTYIAQGPEEDRVLWQYRTAHAAMTRGEFTLARDLLDDALLRLGAVATGDRRAKQARGYFHEESTKIFIGEPYERAMAWYYRGMLYWMGGELDNARACFRSAQLMDADAENNQYQSDFVLFDYLDGYLTMLLGGDGSDHLERARAVARLGTPPPYNPEANTFLFVEFGHGPTKYAAGEYDEKLKFKPGSSRTRRVSITINGQKLNAEPLDNLTYQATTRGGRVMDYVLKNKAVFKGATDAAGNAAIISGAVLASGRNTQEAGLGLLVAGVASKIISAATTPEADTRDWANLPQFLSFASLHLEPGTHQGRISFLDEQGRPLPEFEKTLTINVSAEGKDHVVFVSDRSTEPQKAS